MIYRKVSWAVACAAVLGAMLLGPVAGASASDASIKNVIKTNDAKIAIAEGRALTAIGEYKMTRNAAPGETALTNSIDVRHALKTQIARQTAGSSRVKEGKIKLEKGLHSVIVAYEHLKAAFNVKSVSPQAAKEQAEKAIVSVKKGRRE